MLIATEYFLNIAMKNELLVYKNTGVISVFEPRLNLKEIQSMYNAFSIKMKLYFVNERFCCDVDITSNTSIFSIQL